MSRLLSLLALLALLAAAPAHADEAQAPWTSQDVYSAISDASAATGVPTGLLTDVTACEDPTFDPYAVGALGELGPVQLYPAGNAMPLFLRDYADPFDPASAEMFLARAIRGDYAAEHVGPHSWSCYP